MTSIDEVEREFERLETLDEITANDLDRFKRSLPTDPELARVVNVALPSPWGDIFEFVNREDAPHWRVKPPRNHPNQVRAQEEFADAAREARGIQGTVERDGREVGLAQATIGDQVAGKRFSVAKARAAGQKALRRLRDVLGGG